MTKNRTPTLVYLDPGMHPGLEVKGLIVPIRLLHQYDCVRKKPLYTQQRSSAYRRAIEGD